VTPAQTHKVILATYFTLAGNVRPLAGSIVSPVPFPARAAAAGGAGFEGFGFAQEDLDHVLTGLSYREIGTILADNNLRHVEIEVLLDWFCNGERRRVSDATRRAMLTSAERLGASHIKVCGDITGANWPLEVVIESFAQLCDQARDAGTRVGIELFPGSSIADLGAGLAIVQGAGRDNGGLLLDIWHMVRGGIPFEEIAGLPPGSIIHVELDDAAAVGTGPILEDTIERRRLCGQGDFDIPGFLRSVARTGYEGLYGVEILSDEHRALDVEEAARRAYESTRTCLDRL